MKFDDEFFFAQRKVRKRMKYRVPPKILICCGTQNALKIFVIYIDLCSKSTLVKFHLGGQPQLSRGSFGWDNSP